MKAKPKISLIIPTYNMAKTLPETLDSALEQEYPNYEIIVVDDGSTDRTKKIVDKYREKSKIIKYIYQPNRGLGGARNTGIRNSSGKYFANLDADDIAKKDFLSKMMEELLKSDKKTKAVSPNANYLVEKKELDQTFFGNYNTPKKLTIKKELIGNRIPSTGLIEKKTAQKIGLYRETRHREDYFFWIELLKRGYKVRPVFKPLFLYRIHEETLSTKLAEGAKSEVELFKTLLKDQKLAKYRKIINKRLADSYTAIAMEYLFTNKPQKALKYYLKAVRTYPSKKTKGLYRLTKISPWLTKQAIKVKKRRSSDLKENIQV